MALSLPRKNRSADRTNLIKATVVIPALRGECPLGLSPAIPADHCSIPQSTGMILAMPISSKKRCGNYRENRPPHTRFGVLTGHSFSSSIMVFGSPKIFDTMADAMLTWQSNSENPHPIRAVLVSPFQGEGLYLIYADGIYYGDQPIQMEHQSFNANPNNDQQFTRMLPEILDRLKTSNLSG